MIEATNERQRAANAAVHCLFYMESVAGVPLMNYFLPCLGDAVWPLLVIMSHFQIVLKYFSFFTK